MHELAKFTNNQTVEYNHDLRYEIKSKHTCGKKI
jgi:hypothetical protein